MFTIGDFAAFGQVSARMLRHYDALGLLQPAYTDRLTGYRWYEARQLARLNRIVALKDLGFTLEQVGSILDDKVSAEELRGMLRLRRAELEAQVTADMARLAQVEARLQVIEREGAMPTDDVQVKRIPAVRVAELTGTVAGFEPESIAPVIGPLYDELRGLLKRAGIVPVGPPVAYYEDPPVATGCSSTRPCRSTPIPAAATRSRSWICPRSSAQPRSCTTGPWRTSCPRSRRWRAGSRPTDTGQRAITASCTSSSAPTGTPG